MCEIQTGAAAKVKNHKHVQRLVASNSGTDRNGQLLTALITLAVAEGGGGTRITICRIDVRVTTEVGPCTTSDVAALLLVLETQ